jgi:hypothetical protein
LLSGALIQANHRLRSGDRVPSNYADIPPDQVAAVLAEWEAIGEDPAKFNDIRQRDRSAFHRANLGAKLERKGS